MSRTREGKDTELGPEAPAGQDAGTASPSDYSGADAAADGEAPDAERIVSDVETLKALSDPLRIRILETMASRKHLTWSAKELAGELDVPQTRLYHHIELLVERDLIRVATQRIVSGIIESRYRIAALSFRLDSNLLASETPATHEASVELLRSVFDSARDDVGRAIEAFLRANPGATLQALGDGEPERPVLTRGVAMLTPAKAAEFKQRLFALMAEYDTATGEPGAVPFGFLISIYRTPASKEPTRD
jgi:DNA-binding transcriptional ArsR family regulator